MTAMNRRQHRIFILVLGSVTAVGPFSIDMYLPGFPAIAKDLHTDISHVALSLTSYFIGVSAGQLGYGPLLDRFGRKKPLIAGLLLYIVASIGCGLSPTLHWLVAQRLLLALGGCVGIVAARAMVRDLFPMNEVARIFSTLMLVLGISPIIAPSVGAYVADTYSWRYIFAVLGAIVTIVLIAVIRFLPESRPPDRSVSLHPFNMTRNYIRIFKEPTFVVYAFASAAASTGLFAYISDAPFVFMNLFGMNEQQFGLVFSISACGVIGASQFNRLWLRAHSSRTISMITVIAQSFVGMLLIAGVLTGAPVVVIIALLVCYLAGVGLLSPNTTAIAIEPFAAQAGTASALLGAMQMTAGAIGSALVSFFHNGTALPVTALLTLSSLLSLGLQISYKARDRRNAHTLRQQQTTV
jgi:DHA1 family bicyclomycin/chloramphenicol resistance-like MFS transporter